MLPAPSAPSSSSCTVSRARFTPRAKYPLFVNGVRWFPRLASDRSEEGKLLEGAMSEHTPNATILSWELVGEGIPKRVFACFASALDAFDYVSQVVPEERCFFEVCGGARKMFFDVDISGPVAQEAERHFDSSAEAIGERIVRALIEGLAEVAAAGTPSLELIPARDVRIYESHGPTKRSYHVVFNRGASAAVCKSWHAAVLASRAFSPFADFPAIGSIVDSSVYSVTQQLRLLGAQKSGSGRVKTLRSGIPTAQGEVPIFTRGPRTPQIIFCESLASGRSSALPDIGAPAPRRQRSYGPDLPPSVVDRALDLVAPHGDFDYLGNEGEFLNLKRRSPSFCPTCRVVHDSENPFLILVDRDGGYDVRFDCRRSEAHGGKRNTSLGFVSATKTEAAADAEEEREKAAGFLGTLYMPDGEERLYKEEPAPFEFTPRLECDAPPPPTPKTAVEYLNYVLQYRKGESVPCSYVKDQICEFFKGSPAERGFRVGGKASPLPTLAELITDNGRRVVTKRRVDGVPRDVIVDYYFHPLDERITGPAMKTKTWKAPVFFPKKPFPHEPACLRDITPEAGLFADGPVQVLRGALGVGKTRLVLQEAAAGKRSVLIADKRLLLKENRAALEALFCNVEYYENFVGPICPKADFVGTLAICIDSIYRIDFALAGWKPDLLIVDECESVSTALVSRTAKREIKRFEKPDENPISPCYEVLESLMRNVPRVVFSDASADQATVDFLRHYRREARALHLSREPPSRDVYLYETEKLLMKKLASCLVGEQAEGRCVYFATNSRNKANAIARMVRDGSEEIFGKDVTVPQFDVGVITSEGINSDLGAMASFKEVVSADHALVIASPKIGAGSSYTPEDGDKRYRMCFGLFTPASAPAPDAVQSLFRVREIREFHIAVTGDHGQSPLPANTCCIEDVKRWLSTSASVLRKITGSRLCDRVTGSISPYGTLVAKRLLQTHFSSTKEGFERDMLSRLAENGAVLREAICADPRDNRTIKGVREAANEASAMALAAVELAARPDRYSDEEKVWEAASTIAMMAEVVTPTLPIETARRAVDERWLQKRQVFLKIRREDIDMPQELPASLSSAVRDVMAYHYVSDFSRQQALCMMRKAIPPSVPHSKLVGHAISPVHFSFLPEKGREKAAQRLFEAAGILVDGWTVKSLLWAEGDGTFVRVAAK